MAITPFCSQVNSRGSSLETLEHRLVMSADVGFAIGTSHDSEPVHFIEAGPDANVFHTHFSADHSVTFDGGGALIFEDGATVLGDLVVTGATSVTFRGTIEITGNIFIDADASIVFENALSAGGAVTLISDEIDFLGGLDSAVIQGDLVIRTSTLGRDLQLGFSSDEVAALDLTDADLAAMQVGGKLTLGSFGTGGAVSIDSAVFENDLEIVGSAITVNSELTAKGSRVSLAANAANGSGIVRNDGAIDISANIGGTAGELVMSGRYVGNFGTILALGSEATNGGSVELRSTLQTLVTSAAVIDASGGASGGAIYIWSDANTTVSGMLAARGGAAGGDGGFVEVSSDGGIAFTGAVDTSAVMGQMGMLLIDPKNVVIAAVGIGTLPGADEFSDAPSSDVTIAAATIMGAASAVTIQANNDITVNAALTMGQNLTLQAGRSVVLNQSITLANRSLTIIANDAAGIDLQREAGAGSITTVSGVTLDAGAGTISLTVGAGDAGPAGGITIDRVITSGTLNISTAGFLRETGGDAAPTAGSMTADDDLIAGTLNLTALATNATFGEGLDQGNGAIEVAAGVINANVQLPGAAPASDFVGHFVLTDADHTNGSPGGVNPAIVNAPMVIGTINAGSGTVILTAKGASILGTAGASANISAGQVNLTTEAFSGPNSATHYGAIGSAAAPIRTDVGMLTATATDGGVFIAEANSVFINKIVAQDKGVTAQTGANGSVVVQAPGQNPVTGTSNAIISAGGDVTIVDLKVANQLTLSAGGIIADGNQNDPNILARGLTVNAGAFGHQSDSIETTVMTLEASTSNGGVFVSESDGVNIASITAAGVGNDVSITSGAGSVVLGSINATGGTVTIKAQFDSITDGNGAATNIAAASAVLEARTGLGTSSDAIETNVGNLSTKVSNGGAGIYLANAGTTTGLSVETNNGAVAITLPGGSLGFVQPGMANQLSLTAPGISTFSFANAGGKVSIASINAGSGAVSITAKTSIEDHAVDSTLDITAGSLTLKAGTFIGSGSNALETDVNVLVAAAEAGGVFISDSGSISQVTVNAKGAGSDISLTTVGDMVVAKAIAPDSVVLNAGGSILRTGSVLNISGTSASLSAGTALGSAAEPLLFSAATLTSAVAASGSVSLRGKGAVTASLIESGNGDVEFSTEGNMTLGLVTATGNVKLTSTAGSILDGNGGALNVQGGIGTFTGVSIGTAGDALDTNLASITAVGTSGGVFINELNDINVARIEAQGFGSDIGLTAGGNIILGVAKADGDKVNIRSTAGSISDGNGSALNITADQLDIFAPAGIGALQNSLNKLGSANGGLFGVTISNIGALAITDATLEGRGPGRLTIQADSITILDMSDNVATLDVNGSLELVANSGNIIFLDANDSIRASGTGSIAIKAGLGQTPAYPNTGAVAVIGNLTTAGGTIDVRANHHITIGLLNTGGSGDVTVSSETGIILDGNGAATNIIGNVVTLSGAASTARVAELETTIRIADYSAIRSEAAAKLTNAQSLSTATAIMQIQKDNAHGAKNDAEEEKQEAEAAADSADDAYLAAYITATALDGVATALGIARDIVAIPAGAAQAIPLSGDGGAMTGYSALDVAANAADIAAYAAGIVADQLGAAAEGKANELVEASAKSTALSATYTDSLNTWRAFSEATSVAQKAADAAAIAREHALVVRDQAILAQDQVNVIGTALSPLGIQANELNAEAANGSVFIAATGDFALGGVTATGENGTVSIQASGDIYVSGTTAAPDQVTLKAGGSIIDAGGSIAAPTLLASAQANVGSVVNPIHTTVETVAIKATSGTVGIANIGTLQIGSINGIQGITAGGNVGVTTSSTLTFASAISAPGQVVTLVSTGGEIADAHNGVSDVSALTLNATSANGIDLDTAVANLNASVTAAGSIQISDVDDIALSTVQVADGRITVGAAGSILAHNVSSLTDADFNDIVLTATHGGSIEIGVVNAGTQFGDVNLSSSGGISMLPNGRITADALTATAASGINVTTTANNGDLSVTGVGNLTINESDALFVNRFATTEGAINLIAGGSVTLKEGAVDAASGAGNVTLDAAGALAGPATSNGSAEIRGAIVSLITRGTGSTVGVSKANALEIDAAVRLDLQTQGSTSFIDDVAGGVVVGSVNTGSGDFNLRAKAGGITSATNEDGLADIVAAHIDLSVTGAASKIGTGESGRIEIDGASIALTTEGGSAYLADTAGGIALDQLNVGTGDLFLTANGGAMTDYDGGAGTNITANHLMLSATGGIGSSSDSIEVNVQALEASGGAGGVVITDVAGGLKIGGVTSSLAGVSATGGDIAITALSPLTVNEAITLSGGGNIRLVAGESATGGDDLTVNADVSTADGNGGISLVAGDDITIASNATVSAPGGTVEISGDNGDTDNAGSQVTLLGAVRASRLEITTHDGDDVITIANVIANSHSISSGDGNDTVTVALGTTLGSGTIDTGAGNDGVTTSSALENFVGGTGDDRLLVKAGGSVSGSATGGAGYDAIVYDHDDAGADDFAGPVTVNLESASATAVAAFSEIERFEGTLQAEDQLIGADAPNTWQITGANAGNIGGVGTFDFTGFENVTGGGNDDVFQFAASGSLSGNLGGGGEAGRDSIDFNALNFDAVSSVVLDGATGGTATAVGGRFDGVEEVVGDLDFMGVNSLTGHDAAATWNFTGQNSGNINGSFYFGGFGDITAGDGDNTFTFSEGSIPAQPLKTGDGANVLDMSGWSSALGWYITGDSSGYVVTAAGTFEFSGLATLISGSGDDRFTFSDDKILGEGLASPGMIVGGGGTDFIDLAAYTTRNLWSRTNLDGTIETDRGLWSYQSIEQFLGNETTTFRFDVVDLTGTVTKVALPVHLLPGGAGQIFMNIVNNGNDEALRQRINIGFYLSVDNKLDAGDVLIGTNDGSLINLFQGATKTPFATAVKVPAETAPGSYRLLAVIDGSNVIAEGDETNNIIDGGSIEVHPFEVDLAPSMSTSTLPAEVLPGAKATFSTVIKKMGNSLGKSPVNVEFFLSLDGIIDGDDLLLGGVYDATLNLPAGMSRTFTVTGKVPTDAPAGDYQVLVRVDGADMVVETDETNNVASVGSGVKVKPVFIDLVGQVASRVPTIAIPNDVVTFTLPIKNLGTVPATGRIDVDFYLSTDGTVSGDDVLLKSLENISVNIAPNGERIVQASARVPASILGGTYYVVADIDSQDALAESDESNNSVASNNAMEVVWRFGNFGDRRGVKLVVPDADGNLVTFSMTGQGAGDVLGGSDFSEISLVGTNIHSKVKVTTQGGAITELHDITSTNSLGSFRAPKANLAGDVRFDGVVNHFRVGDVVGESSLSLQARESEIGRTSLRLGHVENLSITSATRIHSLTVLDWYDTDANQDLIQLPRITHLRSAGDFQADLVGTSLEDGFYSVFSLKVNGVMASDLTLPRGAEMINVGGWDGGSVDALFLNKMIVRGDMVGAEVNVSGPNDILNKPALGSMRVHGNVVDSLIAVRQSAGSVRAGTWDAGSVLAVGVDSGGDGTFFDGNEAAIGGTLNSFYTTAYSTANGGAAFGVAVDNLAKMIQLSPKKTLRAANLPFVDGDFEMVVL